MRRVRVARALLALTACLSQLRVAAAPASLSAARGRALSQAPSELVWSLDGGVTSASLASDGLRCLDPAWPEAVAVAFDTPQKAGFAYACRFVAAALAVARDAAAATSAAAQAAAVSTPSANSSAVRLRRWARLCGLSSTV